MFFDACMIVFGMWPATHQPWHVYDTLRIGEQIRGCASAVLRVCNMIELVHAKSTHTYAAARRLSGLPVGCAMLMFFSAPEEWRDVEFPRQPAILADCTTIIITAFPSSRPTSDNFILFHTNSWGKFVPSAAKTPDPFISRSNNKIFKIKQKNCGFQRNCFGV